MLLPALLIALSPQPDPANLRRIFEEALVRRERQYGASDARTAQAARDLGMFLGRQGDAGAARAALEEAVRIDEQTLGASAPQTLKDVAELASVSPPPQALPLWRRASEAADPAVAVRALMTLGAYQAAAGDRPGAAGLYRRAVARQETATGPSSEPVAVCLNALAQVVEIQESMRLLQRALAIDRKALGARHPQTATTETNLAGKLVHVRRYDEALAAAADALSVFGETLGPNHPRRAIAASIMAFALEAKGERARAEKMYRLALAIDEAAYGPQNPQTINDRQALDEFLQAATPQKKR
jgi:tetratricopeptide (TPR) repeat protein